MLQMSVQMKRTRARLLLTNPPGRQVRPGVMHVMHREVNHNFFTSLRFFDINTKLQFSVIFQ